MESEMKCEKCGAAMEDRDGVMTCSACGHTATEEAAPEAPAEEVVA